MKIEKTVELDGLELLGKINNRELIAELNSRLAKNKLTGLDISTLGIEVCVKLLEVQGCPVIIIRQIEEWARERGKTGKDLEDWKAWANWQNRKSKCQNT